MAEPTLRGDGDNVKTLRERSYGEKKRMESSYITALETRAKWLHWGINEGQQLWMERGQKYVSGFQSYLKVLQSGETYFMNKKFCDLVSTARSTVPDDLQFESAWMLSPQGWMWLEEPFNTPDLAEEAQQLVDEGMPLERKHLADQMFPPKISAIGWLALPEGYPTADYMDPNKPGKVTGRGAYQFLCFLDLNIYKDKSFPITKDKVFRPSIEAKKGGFGTWSYFLIQDGDKLIDRINQFEGKTAEFGQGAGTYKVGRERDMLHEMRWIYSAMYMMAQRISITVKHDTDRSTKRRGIRENKPVESFIKVISLRRYEEDKKKAIAAGTHIDWQWQWTVVGHWRNQYYPSTGEYKPKWIEAFIKGPKDKPMKPDSVRVFVARR